MPDHLDIIASYIAQSRPPLNASLADSSAAVNAWNALVAEVKELRTRPAPEAKKD